MPVLASSSYGTAETVLNRIRAILDDSEVAGGDVVTDYAPSTFQILNAAFEQVQIELSNVGVETTVTEWWLIGLPIMPSVDPEARMIIDDSGCTIIYPNSVGNVFSQTPQLPTDLIVPLDLYERQTGTSNYVSRMKEPPGGLLEIEQQLFLVDWEWESDGIWTRGAMQSQDLKIKGEKQLAQLVAPTDPVPIRGVTNAAAYYAAVIVSEARGGMVAPQFKANAQAEIFRLQTQSARRRQRRNVRRRPYTGRGGRSYPYL